MITQTYVKMLKFIPLLRGVTPTAKNLYYFLVSVIDATNSASDEDCPLHLVKIKDVLEISTVKIVAYLRQLQDMGLITLAGIGAGKTFRLNPPPPAMKNKMKRIEEELSKWREIEPEKPSRTKSFGLRKGTLDVINHWNDVIKKPRVTIPGMNSDGTFACLGVHTNIDNSLSKLHADGFSAVPVMGAIDAYYADQNVSPEWRKKISLSSFLENKFSVVLPPSLCRSYLAGKQPFITYNKKSLPEKPELVAPGLFNSLKAKFIFAYCGGRPEGIDERREIYLTIAANKLSAAIKRWGPLLKRKLNSSEWAEYVHVFLEQNDVWANSKGKPKFDPFNTITQDWFVTKAFPMFLARPPACVLESYQVNPVNPQEGRQVASK